MTPSTSNMGLMNERIAEIIPEMIQRYPPSKFHLIKAQDSSLKVVVALQGLELRQAQGTQYLPNIGPLFRKTAGMLDILESLLHNHLSEENGRVEDWGTSERELVQNLGLVFDVCERTARLLLLYNATLEARSSIKNHGEHMAAYCSVIDEVANVKEQWTAQCKGNTFDPEPIVRLLAMVHGETLKYLAPGSSSFPDAVSEPADDENAPPAYDAIAESSSNSWVDEKATSKRKAKSRKTGKSTSVTPGFGLMDGQSSSSAGISPRHVISIPRSCRQNEVVRVSLTPGSSRIMVWSVNCVELYLSGSGTHAWRVDSHDGALATKGVPCQFKDLKCFSPDGSLVCFVVEAGLEAELVILRVNDGMVLGKRKVIEKQVLSVCISNTNKRVALSCTSPSKLDGTIMIMHFDPRLGEGQCFTGSIPKIGKVTGDHQPPSIESCFTPDDCHLVVAIEARKAIPKSSYQARTTRIRVFHVKERPTMVKDWQTSEGQFLNWLPFSPTFLFPPDGKTGKHKWLVAWNNDEATDPLSFKLGDPVHQEVHMKLKEGTDSLSLRQFLGNLTKPPSWAQIRFSDDGAFTLAILRGRSSSGRISVTKGRWEQDGLPATAKDAYKENSATILHVGQDDAWTMSSDGKFAVTYNKEKARVELWSL